MRSGSDRKAKIFFSRKMDFVFLKKLRRKKCKALAIDFFVEWWRGRIGG
jgi:hypothetical protein